MWWILTFLGWLFVLLALVANRRMERDRDRACQRWAESDAQLAAARDKWRKAAEEAGDKLLAKTAAYNAAWRELEEILEKARKATAARAD